MNFRFQAAHEAIVRCCARRLDGHPDFIMQTVQIVSWGSPASILVFSPQILLPKVRTPLSEISWWVSSHRWAVNNSPCRQCSVRRAGAGARTAHSLEANHTTSGGGPALSLSNIIRSQACSVLSQTEKQQPHLQLTISYNIFIQYITRNPKPFAIRESFVQDPQSKPQQPLSLFPAVSQTSANE